VLECVLSFPGLSLSGPDPAVWQVLLLPFFEIWTGKSLLLNGGGMGLETISQSDDEAALRLISKRERTDRSTHESA